MNSWLATTDFNEVPLHLYIGEDLAVPRPIVNAIRIALGLRKLPVVRVYYYGTPDAYLAERFGG